MSGQYRVLVTGSRDWHDWALLAWHLSAAVTEGRATGRDVVVVHGKAPRGADAIADRLCLRFGVDAERHPADWQGEPRKAGILRNALMVSLGANICLCFVLPCIRPDHAGSPPHDSHGAAHCAHVARRGGIPVLRIPGG